MWETGRRVSDNSETQLLIDNARNGDQQAVRRLLVLYHPRLRARHGTQAVEQIEAHEVFAQGVRVL